MDMKLNGQKVRSLRLERSWSQEQLAGKAGLNQRTVQRVETEGSASLRTRGALAAVFGVDPVELDTVKETGPDATLNPAVVSSDSSLLDRFRAWLATRDPFQFILLMLLSLFYLGARPWYFAQSRLNFSWFNLMFGGGKPLYLLPEWWSLTLIFWLGFSGAWLWAVKRSFPRGFLWHAAGMGVVLALAIARVWQPDLVLESVASLLYYCCLVLLVFIYITHPLEWQVRQAVILLLSAYVFLWCFQAISYFSTVRFWVYLHFDNELRWQPFYLVLKVAVMNLAQLLPVFMVLLFSLKHNRGDSGRGLPVPGAGSQVPLPGNGDRDRINYSVA
jgi:transcriptional regulator with XRE-family HTH domain